jgi:hypothetical protein
MTRVSDRAPAPGAAPAPLSSSCSPLGKLAEPPVTSRHCPAASRSLTANSTGTTSVSFGANLRLSVSCSARVACVFHGSGT